jgi:hypothetical protein
MVMTVLEEHSGSVYTGHKMMEAVGLGLSTQAIR